MKAQEILWLTSFHSHKDEVVLTFDGLAMLMRRHSLSDIAGCVLNEIRKQGLVVVDRMTWRQ